MAPKSKIINGNKTKIILATRTKKDGFDACVKKLEELCRNNNAIEKIYIICDLHKPLLTKIGSIKCEIIFDIDPIKPTAFNLILKKLQVNKKTIKRCHLLTYSKEVELINDDIDEMIRTIEDKKNKLIVVGYRLKDNVLSDQERKMYANGTYDDGNEGIAYMVPWSTCALWNKEFVCGNKIKLWFDEICEKAGNQLDEFKVRVNGELIATNYQGMEDGLAIAELVTKNDLLKYKLIKKELFWNIEGDEKRITDHKVKMARKNIVLGTFMQIKGYSADEFFKAAL